MVGDSRRRGILFIHILFRMNQNKARMRSIIYKPLAKEGEKKTAVAREEKGRQRQFGKCNHWFDGRTMKSNDDEKTKIFSLKKCDWENF